MVAVPEVVDVAHEGHLSAITCGSAMGEFAYVALHNQVMTEEQMETLRAQICWYSAICSQLVEMHKAMSQQPLQPSLITGQCMLYDLAAVTPGLKMSARQRWTPTQAQLQILETLFEKGNASPNKLKVKEITIELSQHGQISETNVYNWFQNRKARAKKKQMHLSQKEFESEIETDDESSRKKRAKAEGSSNPENVGTELTEASAQTLQRNCGAVQYKLHTGGQQQFEFEDNDLASLLLSESADEAKHHISFDTTRHAEVVNAGDSFTQSLSEVKPVHLLNTVSSAECGMSQTMLQDFHGHTIPTNNIGFTSHPLHTSKGHTFLRLIALCFCRLLDVLMLQPINERPVAYLAHLWDCFNRQLSMAYMLTKLCVDDDVTWPFYPYQGPLYLYYIPTLYYEGMC